MSPMLSALRKRGCHPAPTTLWYLRLPAQAAGDLDTAALALSAGLAPPPRRSWWRPGPRAEALAALELLAQQRQVNLGLRGTPATLERLFGQLRSTYRAGEVQPSSPRDDPLELEDGEAASVAVLHLAAPPALPLAVPTARAFAEGGDPLPGLLSTLAAVPAPLRAVAQLVLAPAPGRWAARYATLLARAGRPRGAGRLGRGGTTSSGEIALAVLAGFALLVWLLLQAGQLPLLLLLLLLASLVGMGAWTWWTHARRAEQLLLLAADAVRAKLGQSAAQVTLRLLVLGPEPLRAEREAFLEQLIQGYSGAGAGLNRLQVGARCQATPAGIGLLAGVALTDLAAAARPHAWLDRLALWFRPDQARPVLSYAEVALFFHYLPQAA
jgi:hypothetical protein